MCDVNLSIRSVSRVRTEVHLVVHDDTDADVWQPGAKLQERDFLLINNIFISIYRDTATIESKEEKLKLLKLSRVHALCVPASITTNERLFNISML